MGVGKTLTQSNMEVVNMYYDLQITVVDDHVHPRRLERDRIVSAAVHRQSRRGVSCAGPCSHPLSIRVCGIPVIALPRIF